ncbi:MAG: AAA family ATPase, partial [Deltaproteobacteria bacterium]|nr:AAA family ATPase [Deltaproteobacteria bacterium]
MPVSRSDEARRNAADDGFSGVSFQDEKGLMIIGITGRNASGKGEVAEILKKCGLNYLSISDEVREEVRALGLEVTRENLISVGQETRKIWGVDVFARRCAEKIEIDKNYVVDSFRHPAEVLYFRKFADFTLIEVSAEPAVRFERVRLRGRENDPTTFGEFLEIEKRELGSGDRTAQQLVETAQMADIVIENDGSLEEK